MGSTLAAGFTVAAGLLPTEPVDLFPPPQPMIAPYSPGKECLTPVITL